MSSSDDQAEARLYAYRRALAVNPRDMDALVNSGAVLHGLGRFEEALAFYDAAIAVDAAYVLCLVNRALTLHALDRFAEAVTTLDYAAMLAPDDPEVPLNRGHAHLAMGNLDQALADFARARALIPADPRSSVGRAVTLAARGEFPGALAAIEIALRQDPARAETHFYHGNILRDAGRLEAALAAYDAALRCDPEYIRALRNKGHCLLLAGDFARGLPLYECRKQLHPPVERRDYPQPLWTGAEDIAGKTVFAYIEQGLGDTIQFFRFAQMLAARGARVVLSCQTRLRRLLAASAVEIIAADAVPERFDYHIPLASIPLAMEMTLPSLPAQAAYLFAEPELVARWRARLGEDGFRIGIAWQCGPGVDDARAFPVRHLAPIAALPGVRLVSLQKGAGPEQMAGLPVQTFPGLDDGPDAFVDTAALIANLDLVVTPDTAIAHLAGAMGRPAAVMLKQVPDWRWLMDRVDSPWYPSLTLARQPGFADWAGAFAGLRRYLLPLLDQRTR